MGTVTIEYLFTCLISSCYYNLPTPQRVDPNVQAAVSAEPAYQIK